MMYGARQPRMLHEPENTKHEKLSQQPAGKAGKAPPLPPFRRTLGDISNFINVSDRQDGITKPVNLARKIPIVDRPITRRSGVQLVRNADQAAIPSILPTGEAEVTEIEVADKFDGPSRWGAKERRSARSKDPKSKLHGNSGTAPLDPTATSVDTKASDNAAIHPCHLARMKALLNNHSGKSGTVKERGVRTLTSTLTTRSEAACVENPSKCKGHVPNIDEGDVGNELAVVDYVEDIYSFYWKTEGQSCVPEDYMSKQTDINYKMRAILIDWLVEVHLKFKLMPETLFLTVNILDRYLSVRSVARKTLQLVGMTATLIAAKYEEIWAPEVNDFILISDNAYTRQQILDMEKYMLNTLRFNLTVPTPYVFLVRLLKAAQSDHQMNMLAFFLVELSLVEYMMVKYSPSVIAAAAVYTAQCTLYKVPNWTAALLHYSHYTEEELKSCATAMADLHQQAKTGKLTAVYRKYSLPKFHSVTELRPAIFFTKGCGFENCSN